MSENIRIAGHGIQARIDHDQFGALAAGIGEFTHERRVANGRIGSEQYNEFSLVKFRKGVPEPAYQMIAQVTAVVTGRVIGKIIG